MVKVKNNLVGREFGRLKVLEQAEDYVRPSNGRHYARWLCECSCEEHNLVTVLGLHLVNKNGTRSCGCLSREWASNLNKKYNTYDLSGEYGIGYCSNTDTPFYFDLEDYDKIKDYCWSEHIRKDGYHELTAWDSYKGGNVNMHWVIVGLYYDHIDRNPLNNQKENLRVATSSQNAQNQSMHSNNTSGITGVAWDKSKNSWVAYINIDKKLTKLGTFINKEDAIKARLRAERKYYGEFASQQHLYEQYEI